MNELYKIMLVDDEEEVRTSIIKKIPWEELGFVIVGDAENGQDALEKAEYLEPDVVITDIKMPYMDGLTLGARLREKLPSVKLIIFSGFDEFEYAKQAIQLHVIEYVLKPVNATELTLILKKVKQTLDDEIESLRDVERLRKNYYESLPILKERYLVELIRGKVQTGDVYETLKNYDSLVGTASKWLVCAVQIEEPKSSQRGAFQLHQEPELIPLSVKALVNEKMQETFLIETIIYSGYILVLVGLQEEQQVSHCIDIINDLCKESKKILGLTITIGIGTCSEDISRIYESYKEARSSVDYKVLAGSGLAIYIEDMEGEKKPYQVFTPDEKLEGQLLSALKFGDAAKVTLAIENIFALMDEKHLSLRQYQTYLLTIINDIVQLVVRYELDLGRVMDGDPDYFEAFMNFQSISQMKKWMLAVCLKTNECISEKRDDREKSLITSAKTYIYDNYQNPDLSLEWVCNHLHISPAYFSTLFKKETGQSYVAFLTEVRLSRAAALLAQTEDKTYIVANKVGYAETNYFSYVFKKKYGISPTKYRGSTGN